MRVMVVEDDVALCRVLHRGLTMAGWAVDTVHDGPSALAQAGAAHDAVLLDVMLPGGLDGVEVCRRLRRDDYWGAILMLTARGAVDDRVRGLDAGADDYLVKPFTLAELAARLRAQTRRPVGPRPAQLVHGALRLDPAAHRVWRGVVEIELSQREFALLSELLRHPGQVLTREMLLERIWQSPDFVSSNVVDQTVRYLRRKVDLPFGTDDVETVRGVGYRLRAPSAVGVGAAQAGVEPRRSTRS